MAVLVVVLGTGVALAWTLGTTNPGTGVTAATLAAPTGPDATKSTGIATNCTAVDVTWTKSAAPVNTYIVEAKTGNGAWTTVDADTGDVATIVDTTLYTQREVTYRVAGRYTSGALTNWMSPTVTDASPLLCGSVGEVDDLVAVANCGSASLSWTAATSATSYDRQAQQGVAAYVADGANVAFGPWTHSAAHPGGSSMNFQVRPGIGTGDDGNWSNTANVPDWGFYVKSVTFGDGDGTIEQSDTVVVTFNRAVAPGSITGTGSNLIYVRTTGTKGVGIAAAGTGAAAAAIGFITTTANMGPGNGTHAGTGAWSAGSTVWTWTKNATSVPLASTTTPGFGAYSVGSSASNPSRVKCSDSATNQMVPATAPTITGSF